MKRTDLETIVKAIEKCCEKNEELVVEPPITWSVWYQETYSNPYFAVADPIEREILLYEGVGTAPTEWAGVPLDENGRMIFHCGGDYGESSVFFKVVVN